MQFRWRSLTPLLLLFVVVVVVVSILFCCWEGVIERYVFLSFAQTIILLHLVIASYIFTCGIFSNNAKHIFFGVYIILNILWMKDYLCCKSVTLHPLYTTWPGWARHPRSPMIPEVLRYHRVKELCHRPDKRYCCSLANLKCKQRYLYFTIFNTNLTFYHFKSLQQLLNLDQSYENLESVNVFHHIILLHCALA